MAANHVITYIIKGAGYASTSACAIIAGYLMQTKQILWGDLLVLSIPIITSVFFFMCYAKRFYSVDPEDKTKSQVQSILQQEAITSVFPIIAILLILLIVFTQNVTWKLLLAFGIYALMYGLYGWFFLIHPAPEKIPVIRHRLVWPVVLSIAISLYYGLTFSILSISLKPLIPIGVIVFMYLLPETFHWSKKIFITATLAPSFGVAAITLLVQTNIIRLPVPSGIGGFFSLMLFCVIASAYLAVFESWKVTSEVAEREQVPTSSDSSSGTSSINKATQYSIASLTALMLSVWSLPLFFIFSGYGTVFLTGFAIHAFISFFFWYIFGQGKYLTTFPWDSIKITAGLLFLGLLVLVTFLDTQIQGHFLKGFASWDGLSILGWISTLALGTFFWDLKKRVFRRKRKQSLWLRIFAGRINFVCLLTLLCWVGCFILLAILPNYEEGSTVHYKIEFAFGIYGICILICFIAVLLDLFGVRPPMSTIGAYISGFLILARVVTSLLIALVVLLPSINKGNSIGSSLLFALPFFLSAIGGFALNDYCDSEKDSVNKPYRAIPSGKLHPTVVLSTGLIALGFAVVLAILVARSGTELILYGLTICGVAFYNIFVKYFSLSKTFLTSAVSALPVLYSVITFNYSTVYLLLPVATAAFVLGREWLMDIRDINGDTYDGIVTVPMRIGPKITAKLGFMLQLLSILLLFSIAVSNQSYSSFVLVLLVSLSIFFLIALWYWRSGAYQRRVIQGLWLPMLLGELMLLQ